MYEKQSRNNNRSSDTIASFLLKTYEILEHPEYERMISWDKSNVGFIINDVVSFTREILPKYFRHSNFSSFVRQLNMYDFHKVKQENQSLVFKNPLFCKGEQQNLKFIRRKAAKKVSGLRKQHISDRNDADNEKYENLLKGFKKSFETEINHSSFFYERSIQLMKDLAESSLKKKKCIQELYVSDEQHETQVEDGKLKLNEKEQKMVALMSENQESKPRKDTLIQIPKQFICHPQVEAQKQNNNPQTHSSSFPKPNNDQIMKLKEQIYKSLGVYQSWLQDYIQINKKKVKYISSSRQQLIKCRENRNAENQQNQQNLQGHENDHQNEQVQEEQKPVSLEEINQRQEKNISQDKINRDFESPFLKMETSNIKIENDGTVFIKPEIKNVPPVRLFEPPKSIERSFEKVNGASPLQTGFMPTNQFFSPKLFSTFVKPKDEKPEAKKESQENSSNQEENSAQNKENAHALFIKEEEKSANYQ